MLIAGNWKMNTAAGEARDLARAVASSVRDMETVDVAVCPPFVHLVEVSAELRGSHVRLGAQNMHSANAGAFTGEVSARMLKSVGCHYVIIGHSERRQYFGETDIGVNVKVRQALDHGLLPIVCVGELLEERQAGREKEVVSEQVRGALAGMDAIQPGSLVVAYEPVWAIGTGETATPATAQDMHRFVRSLLREVQGADSALILYGGSMKPGNARALLQQPDIDGGLIGGASLRADTFAAIVAAAAEEA